MKIVKTLLAAAISLTAFGAQANELVTNGSFESITGSNPVGTYRKVNAGETDIVGWTVGGTSVDIINSAYGAISGNSIDMLGSPGPGSLSQMLSTVVGQTYVLSFDLSYNGGTYKDIGVSLAGGAQTFFTGGSPFNHHTLQYTATSASTQLAFFSTGDANYSGAVLDNVSVAAVPEPETYAMLLAGLGLMGGIARRRRNKQA
jgi:choice-of-anchor C domain-containing protein